MKVSEKQFELGFQSTVDLYVNKGKVEIWGWDNSSCKIQGEEGQDFNLDYSLKNDFLQMEIKGGEDVVIHLPRYCKLIVEGNNSEVTISNFEGNVALDIGKGKTKICNVDGKGIIEMEKGHIELENIRGSWYVENGNGDVKIFKSSGTLKLENGHGDIELINVNGDCDVENGKGEMVIKDSGGSINLYNGLGGLALENCSFKRLAADGKGDNNISLSNSIQGVWRMARSGNYDVKVPVTIQLDFQIQCNSIENTVPGLSLSKKEEYYTGALGFNPKASIHIEEARGVSLSKGLSGGVVDSTRTDEEEKETLKILDMLKQGIISLEQANELLDALENKDNDKGVVING